MRPVRVLLVWPGTDGAASGNFGVPQLVTIASYLRERTGAHVDIIDLVCERALGPIHLPKLFRGPDGAGYDIVGLSCYASYDFLKIDAIARVARATLPEAVLVSGGYHTSARPGELFEDGAPFDAVVVGEGEKPLAKLVEMVAAGARPQNAILGPDPIEDLDRELPPSDWSLLAKYLPVMRKVASQLMIYLSRGCPFDCAFCMERAKREVSWRAFSVDRAIDEMRRLAAFADLAGMTIYVADALFGMRPSWRRAFLAALARERLTADKIWLLIRVDLTEEDDLRLFREANCSPGFGLESGDPRLLGTIRKAGRLDDYLERMIEIAARARELDVPWGANVIMGHPGETEATMRTTAKYLSDLFLDPRGTTGFLSVDPFRLYPGSPIDDERAAWEARFGTRFHRPHWWKDGDQEFLSEWVDPSESLDYRRKNALTHDLLTPVLARIRDNFVYRGAARDYFLRAVDDQARTTSERNRLHFIGRHYAWNKYTGRIRAGAALLRRDPEAATLLRSARDRTLQRVARDFFGGAGDASLPPVASRGAAITPSNPSASDPASAAAAWLATPLAAALRDVPRERFVPLDQLLASTQDEAIALDATGLATVSALHAYARTFHLARIDEGARVLDLGGGTGYGATLLAHLVGPTGRVVSIEVDPRLCAAARTEIEAISRSAAPPAESASQAESAPQAESAIQLQTAPVAVLEGDSLDEAILDRALAAAGGPFDAIVCGFAVPGLPAVWGRALRDGGVVVAPVGEGPLQTLVRATWRDGAFTDIEPQGEVRYVRARRSSEVAPLPAAAAPAASRAVKAPRALRVL